MLTSYRPPSSVYLAEVSAFSLAGAACQVSRATRAWDADDARQSLQLARDQLEMALDRVDAAMRDVVAQLDASLSPEPKQLGDVAAVVLSDALAEIGTAQRLVPRIPGAA